MSNILSIPIRGNEKLKTILDLVDKQGNLLIQIEFLKPADILIQWFLLFLLDQKITHNKVIHIGPHKTCIRILGGADNRFPPDIERGIDNSGTTIFFFKFRYHFMI